MSNNSNIPVQYLERISFSTYATDEIKKLSVMEVTNPQSFDVLQHPTKCGLYDLRLGSTDRNDLCGTCFQSSIQCPGHFGHINLPVPVFNPLFIHFTFKLLKGACLSCHHFRASQISCDLILAQLKVLEYGLVRTANEMEHVIGSIVNNKKGEVDEIKIKEKLDKMINEALKDSEADMQDSLIKNVVECRHNLVKAFMRDHIAIGPRVCTKCMTLKRTLRLESKCKLIINIASVLPKIVVKEKSTSKFTFADEFEDAVVEDDPVEDVENNEPEKHKGNQMYITVLEAREHLYKLCKNENELILHLFGAFGGRNIDAPSKSLPVEGLFIDVLPVPPSRFRPLLKVHARLCNNPHSFILEKVVQCSITIRQLLLALKTTNEFRVNEKFSIIVFGGSNEEKFQNAWFYLQRLVNKIFDADLDRYGNDRIPGVKQLIEKKEGLFRMNMMGKRVNYAARSVISPDPYIDVDEIGIPETFAKKLTYPQPVTPWNIKELRQAVINGPDIYPGATLIKNEDGTTVFLGRNVIQRQAVAKSLLTPTLNSKFGSKIVYRHLRPGDVLLINRQPTLHRPSIMAHKVRVLPGEKTLRLNYSNCKTYNADFDGDEMNAHFPQNELARSEAYTVANVGHQYLVPKDGTPLGGLIQDHIVAAVLMMIRGKFFSREDYHQLVFGGLTSKDDHISLLKPSILRPCCLWSGKQVISTIIINTIPTRNELITLTGTSKISAKSWKRGVKRPWIYGGTALAENEMSESEVIIRHGELLCGILDKNHFGATPYGLVHCCYELYGGEISSQLLSRVARLFTQFLQIEGFTLGVEDILVTSKADKKREKIMKHAKNIGIEATCEAFELPPNSSERDIKSKLAEAHLSIDDDILKDLDLVMKRKTDAITNDINSKCVPGGLLKKFPENNLQLMVVSGAKGTSVNCMQISSLLGQIELEGRRPPLMLSGRTLPSFLPYDTSPRAGGFIDGRFLTGIGPQECFFHCMAGREGLIDTAVKTSRSGYLQRCLVKHLEGITVGYDLTVRDSDGSVIQFQYGEDSLDISKLQFLKENQLKFLTENAKTVFNEAAFSRLLQNCDYDAIVKKSKKIRKYLKKSHNDSRRRMSGFTVFSKTLLPELDMSLDANSIKRKLVDMWSQLNEAERAQYMVLKHIPDPINAIYRTDLALGAISEKMDSLIAAYLHSSSSFSCLSSSTFTKMMHYKILSSVCEPGESVGLLSAQSVGEPSTQMTLNTFHFAGRGEMNVTLGIPRLREILMVASSKIATPALEVPFLQVKKLDKQALHLKKKLTPVYLTDVLQSLKLKEKLILTSTKKLRQYTVFFQFLPFECYRKQLLLKPSQILYFMEQVFFSHFAAAIQSALYVITKSSLVSSVNVRQKSGPVARDNDEERGDDDILRESTLKGNDEESSGDEGKLEDDDDATTARMKAKRDQDWEYEEMDEEDKKIQALESISDEENEEFENPHSTPTEVCGANDDAELEKPVEENLNSQDRLTAHMRIANVLKLHKWITDYRYDTENEEWCELTLSIDVDVKNIDMTEITKKALKKSVVHHTKGINKAFVVDERRPVGTTEKVLKTDGINIEEMFKYRTLLDVNRLYCNDIHAVANTYGIEAALKVIVKEVQKVFGVYGIVIDPRHLLLIADYMTFEGKFKPFSRVGMESSSSPLQQMSFETAMNFLRNATVSGQPDTLKSPSSRLAIGRPVSCGTGSFDLILPLKP